MVLNSVDNFLDEESDGSDAYNEGNELSKNVVSTEGCFACNMGKETKGPSVQLSRQFATTGQPNRRTSRPSQQVNNI